MTPDETLELLAEWKVAYQTTFAPVRDSAAFADLAVFCHERESCVVPGDRDQSYVREGRRQVILRIKNFLDLSPQQLVTLHTRPAPKGAISHD